MHDLHRNLADNVRKLREAHGSSQQTMADISGIPRPTWASLESGAANPTISVLNKAASALQVSIEELLAAPRTDVQFYCRTDIKSRRSRGAVVRPLVPIAISGLETSRMDLDPKARLAGVPHTPGTREYLSAEKGVIELIVAGEHWTLRSGEMLAFRGDQRHTYYNPSEAEHCIAMSIVCFAAR